MWAAEWAEEHLACGERMWAAEWAEQLVERGCGQLNGQNSLLREDVGS